MTHQNETPEDSACEFANIVYDQILDKIFLPAAAGESVGDYFQRLGIDTRLPPIEFIKVLERVRNASVQLSHTNVWIIAMRFTALLFAMREQEHAKIAIKELAKTMPEFPLEPLLDQVPSEYVKDILHPESSESRALDKLNVLLDRRLSSGQVNGNTLTHNTVTNQTTDTKFRQILHVQVGSADFEPTDEDLKKITATFTEAFTQDKAVVTTRFDVNASIIGMEVPVVTAEKEPTDRDLVIQAFELCQKIKGVNKLFTIDESGFFHVDANGDKFPLYVATPMGRSEPVGESDADKDSQ